MKHPENKPIDLYSRAVISKTEVLKLLGKVKEAQELLTSMSKRKHIPFRHKMNAKYLGCELLLWQGGHKQALENLDKDITDLKNILTEETVKDKCWIRTHMAKLYKAQGWIQYNMGQLKSAEEACQVALQILDELSSNDDQSVFTLQAEIKNSLAAIYLSKGEFDEAGTLWAENVEYFEEQKDQQGMLKAAANLGNAFWMRRDYKKAEELFNRALKIARKIGAKRLRAIIHNNLGLLY